MTSASIMFTVFVLGGSTNYFMEYIGLSPNPSRKSEMVALTAAGRTINGGSSGPRDKSLNHPGSSRTLDAAPKSRRRQRLKPKGSEATQDR
jgi:hypothetical protein